MTRPRIVVLATAVTLIAAVPACAGQEQDGGSVTVLAPWTGTEPGTEGYEFRSVLRKFTEKTGISVEYEDVRAVSQVVLANVQAGTPPDVAILSSPGELASYIRDGHLHPLNDVVGERDLEAFRRLWLLPQEDGRVYTVPVKANLKGLIWYNSRRLGQHPRTWDELMAYSQSLVDSGMTPWCMGMGDAPNSGWPGTDAIEDILLRQAGPRSYRLWAAGALGWSGDSAVEQAWRTWGAIAGDPRFIHGGQKTALLTDFADSGRPLFADPPGCLLELQASFAMGFYRGYEGGLEPGRDLDFLSVTAGGEQRNWTASGDLAAMFNDTPQARELMRFLATDAQVEWPKIKGSSAFTVNENADLDVYGDTVSKRIAQILRSADVLCFDAADVMPSAMRNAFNRAVMEYLNDPSQLDTVLDQLDRVRTGIDDEDWLDLACD